MKTPLLFWKPSLAVLTVMVAWLTVSPPVQAADPAPAPVVIPPRAHRLVPTVAHAPLLAKPGESKEAQALRSRLEAIRLETVMFDALPLSEVVKQLSDEAVKKSPDKSGVNFLFSRARPAPAAYAVDPATGLPRPAEEVDLAGVAIRIMPPLRDVRLVDVLDAIVKVADHPIKYTLESYAVVFSADRGESQPLHRPGPGQTTAAPVAARDRPAAPLLVRVFVVPRSFPASAARTFQVEMQTASAEQVCHGLRQVFERAGVRAPLHHLLYNDSLDGAANSASLLVRAAPEDMDIIQATIEFLGGHSTERNQPSPDRLPPPPEPPAPAK